MEWYQRAALFGYSPAMNSLGVSYRDGNGVTKDYKQAMDWFVKAAAAGDSDAMLNIGFLYADGQGVTTDYAKAKEWYQKADQRWEYRCF